MGTPKAESEGLKSKFTSSCNGPSTAQGKFPASAASSKARTLSAASDCESTKFGVGKNTVHSSVMLSISGTTVLSLVLK